MYEHSILSRFFGAVGGIIIGFVILFCSAVVISFFKDDIFSLFQKELLVVIGTPFAILGAVFPQFTKWIGENLLSHLP